MKVAIVGAGVSGLTCATLLVERGFRTSILADETGLNTTSGVAAALWFPYDAEPIHKVIPWALESYRVLTELTDDPKTGVSMIELRQFSRAGTIKIPEWAIGFGAHRIPVPPQQSPQFADGFAMNIPLTDTTVYLDYLSRRFVRGGGEIRSPVRFRELEEVDGNFDLIINCAGIGARELAKDPMLEPHRGQVAVVRKIEDLQRATVCDDPPLMYIIPRRNDCVFGGTNEINECLEIDPDSTNAIMEECSRVLGIERPAVLAERVGLRPFRKSGVRLESERLRDGRTVIHNYGHGGSGFTLSWGCAHDVLATAGKLSVAIR